jgi:hypothetical protein
MTFEDCWKANEWRFKSDEMSKKVAAFYYAEGRVATTEAVRAERERGESEWRVREGGHQAILNSTLDKLAAEKAAHAELVKKLEGLKEKWLKKAKIWADAYLRSGVRQDRIMSRMFTELADELSAILRLCVRCGSPWQEKFNNGNGAWVCTVCRKMQES